MNTGFFQSIPDLGKYTDFSQFTHLGNNAFTATRELVSLNGRFLEKILDNQIKFANLCVETSERQMHVVDGVKDYNEYAQKQKQLLEELGNRFSEAAEQNVKLATEAGEEYQGWFRKNLEVSADAAGSKEAVKGSGRAKAKA